MDDISLNILFFGALKSYFGNTLQLTVNLGDSLEDVILKLRSSNGLASDILSSCQLAVNGTIVNDQFVLLEPCEIAVLPPFSGG